MKVLRPIEDMLLIKDLGTATSIDLNSSCKGVNEKGQIVLGKKEDDPMHVGEVLALGKGLIVSGIGAIPMDIKVGDMVLYVPSISTMYEYKDGKSLVQLIRYKAVYSVVEDKPNA